MAALLLTALTCAQNHVSFPTRDGWTIYADLYGSAHRCVVLAHGGRFEKGKIRAQYEKAPNPKELVILEGSAHAQFIFQTDQGTRLMREILRFLSAP
jgi:hypothetical protein